MDADSDMDVNNGQAIEIDAKNAKIEWEVLKKEIQGELALVTAQLKELNTWDITSFAPLTEFEYGVEK